MVTRDLKELIDYVIRLRVVRPYCLSGPVHLALALSMFTSAK